MTGAFDVSTTAMQQSQKRIVSNAGEIRSELAALRGKLAALQGQWIGDGNVAFTGAQQQYERANQKLNNALDTIGSLVQSNLAQYTGDDDNARSGITSSASGMDVPVPGF